MLTSHAIEIRVRYNETDPMGFVHHANYFTYFELGRTELLRASGGSYRRMEEEGLLVVVVKALCKYQRPARYDDVLKIETHVKRVTAAKIEHEYLIFRDDEPLAQAQITLAVVNREGAVQRIPEWMSLSE
ncbi:MAG: thioesterase family protein [Pirellulaceae bacterium]|nr:thioesterase family protein [Pirellulaceae bacterium]